MSFPGIIPENRKESFKVKIQGLLTQTDWNEQNTHHLMGKIRIFLEQNNLKSKYNTLNLFCNYLLHDRLSDSALVFNCLQNLSKIFFTNWTFIEGSSPNSIDLLHYGQRHGEVKEDITKYLKSIFSDFKKDLDDLCTNELNSSPVLNYKNFIQGLFINFSDIGKFELTQKHFDIYQEYINNPLVKNDSNKKVLELLDYYKTICPPPNHRFCFKILEFLGLKDGHVYIGIMNFNMMQHQFKISLESIS